MEIKAKKQGQKKNLTKNLFSLVIYPSICFDYAGGILCTNITAEYTLQKENFHQKIYFINAKFAEFKSRLLIGLHKLCNDSLYKWFKNQNSLIFPHVSLTILSQVSKLNSIHISSCRVLLDYYGSGA